MSRRQGGTLGTFTPLSTPNAPTGLSVSTSIGSASVSFTAPTDTGDGAITSFIVTAIDESTGASSGATGSASPITISPGGGTFKIRAQAVNNFGPGRLTEFDTGNAIYSGAELYAWGNNLRGRLGDDTIVNKSSPVQVGALTNWSQVDAGNYAHNVAVKTDNTLWAWGNNSFYGGNLGDNTVINRSSPVQIGALTNWSQAAAGSYHSMAVKTDGTLWAWGLNNQGQRGDGNAAYRSSPVQVGALTNWSQVSAANRHTAAITSIGGLYVWGFNNNGQVGDGTAVNRSSPVQIGALTNWSQVDANGFQTGAVKTDGTIWVWGANNYGQTGDGTTVNKSSPVQIGALTNWSQVNFGSDHTVAVKTDNTLWVWGRNQTGQLGDNTTVNKSSPVQVGALTDWLQVAGGGFHTVAVKADGTIWTWGDNSPNGQLGDGTVVDKSSPVQVGSLTNWLQSSAGSTHTIATLGVV